MLAAKKDDAMPTAPDIAHSTRQERQAYIDEAFACLADCDLCGKCKMLHGRDADEVYADYIAGKRDFLDITMQLRHS